MYISKPGQLPEAELDIMRVLWNSGIAMSVSEIVAALSLSRSWKNATANLETTGEKYKPVPVPVLSPA